MLRDIAADPPIVTSTIAIVIREELATSRPEMMNVVGLALRDHRKIVDKITKGAKLHS